MFKFLFEPEKMVATRVSWVYKLSKDQLIDELQKINVDATGTKHFLRARFISYVRSHPEEYGENQKTIQIIMKI